MTQSKLSDEQVPCESESTSTSLKHSFDMGSSDDGRKLGDWQSRYVKEAKKEIVVESIYCGVLLILCPICILVIWYIKSNHEIFTQQPDPGILYRYAYAWFAGLYGGAVFITKWLYHSVGKGFWNIDRRLWRFLSPLISSALAAMFIWMIDSTLITVFDKTSIQKTPMVLTIAFLVGIFSDNATAKMSEIASMLFGKTKEKE